MQGLYLAGRQSEALELYATLRGRLVGELGLEPSPSTRELQEKILRHEATVPTGATPRRHWPALPVSPNNLLGREGERTELRKLVVRDDVRLITLTGPGGIGKTRLALEVAKDAAPAFASGATFVSLGSIHDPTSLAAAIGDALGIEGSTDVEALGLLAVALGEEELLLVLDGMEHLRMGAPALSTLLASVPGVTLLLTSRAVLHLSGEHVYPVGPLTMDSAVELFLDRIVAADPTSSAAEDREVIREICARLDAIPLALELAAGRARTIPPSALLGMLGRRLPLLGSGPRDLPARQRTLRATLESSHDLLTEAGQRLLRRFAVFTEPPQLASIEEVCGGTVESLEELVDHSFVTRVGTEPRFHMLETVREFALELLTRSGEYDRMRGRHADHVLARLGSEEGNRSPVRHSEDVRLALQWLVDRADPRLAEMVVLAGRHWHAQGRLLEARRLIDSALATEGDGIIRAELLGLLAVACLEMADLETGRQAAAEAERLARRWDGLALEAWAITIAAELAAASGEAIPPLLDRCEEAVVRLRPVGRTASLADALVTLGKLRFWCGRQSEDTEALEEALDLAGRTNNRAAELLALEWFANTFVDLRAPTDVAIEAQERFLRLAEGAPRAEAGILAPLSWLYGYAGRFDEARATLARSIRMFSRFGSVIEAASAAMNAGSIELLAEDPVAAERLLRRGLDELEAVDEGGYRATITAYLAEALHQQGRFAEAAEMANRALTMNLPAMDEAWVLAIEAKARARDGALAAGRDLIGRADERARESPAMTTVLLGELMIARGEIEDGFGNHQGAAAAFGTARDVYIAKRVWPLVIRMQRLLAAARYPPMP
jgi:predicted ATPase